MRQEGSHFRPVPGPDFKPGVRHSRVAGGFDTHWLPPNYYGCYASGVSLL